MNQKDTRSPFRLLLPFFLGLLVIPIGQLMEFFINDVGGYFLVITLGEILFYVVWWCLGKLSAKFTCRPRLSILLLNTPAFIIGTLHTILTALKHYELNDTLYVIFYATHPIYGFSLIFAIVSEILPLLFGLILMVSISYLGCGGSRKAKKN